MSGKEGDVDPDSGLDGELDQLDTNSSESQPKINSRRLVYWVRRCHARQQPINESNQRYMAGRDDDGQETSSSESKSACSGPFDRARTTGVERPLDLMYSRS